MLDTAQEPRTGKNSVDLIASLRSFLRVAETGSFSAVAAESGVTQPAISRQMSALEEHFGTRLVHRSTHAVTLTEEGRLLVPEAQRLVDSVDSLLHSTGQGRTKPIGRVRLKVPVVLGLYLSGKIRALLDQYPELAIDLVMRDGNGDLIEEGLDIEIRVGEVVDSSLICRRIGLTTAAVVTSPEYLNGRTEPAHPNDLQQHECIVYKRWGREDVWWFSSPDGNLPVQVRGRFRANSPPAVYRAVLSGYGIALLSHLLVQDDIREGRLRVLMPEFPPLRLPLSIVYLSRRNLPLRTRIVIDFLVEALRADPAMASGHGSTKE